MDFTGIEARIKELCGEAVLGGHGGPARDPYLRIRAERLVEVMTCLRDDPELCFDLLISISAVDNSRFEPAKPKVKKGETPPPDPEEPENRFDLVYHLLSSLKNHRLVVKVGLPGDPDPEALTISEVFPAAEWHEREAWDLMGIRFEGHPDLRRILCCEDWTGHPLRKDYEFPKEYHGISAE